MRPLASSSHLMTRKKGRGSSLLPPCCRINMISCPNIFAHFFFLCATIFFRAKTSISAASPFLPWSGFHVPVVCIVASHSVRNLQHSVIKFGVKIFFSYFSKSQLNISCSMPHSSCVNSIRIRYNITFVSSLLKCPRRYCNCPYPCTAAN
jgi:hypothetical protein